MEVQGNAVADEEEKGARSIDDLDVRCKVYENGALRQTQRR